MDSIFNKIIEENFPNLEKEIAASNSQDAKKKEKTFPRHTIVKAANIQNKQMIFKH
jgi:hypothetical protein